jgi:hypothetical protein
MRMPGFTAEASFREAATGYRASALSPRSGEVVPEAACWRCRFVGPVEWGNVVCGWGPCLIERSP